MRRTDLWRCGQQTLRAAAALAICLAVPALAAAAPVTITEANVWRADRMPNPIGLLPTALVPWVQVVTDGSGDVANTVVTASHGSNTYTLQRIPLGVLAGIYFSQIPYDPTLTGPWTITATNLTDTATATRPAFVPVDAMPFVDDISFTGTGNEITVHWEITPAGLARLSGQQVSIWDLSTFAAPTTVQFFAIDADVRELDLSTLGLNIGTLYAVEINNVDRNGTTGYIDAFSGNWLAGWTPTEGEVQLPGAVPEPAMLSLLFAGLAGAGLRRRAARRA